MAARRRLACATLLLCGLPKSAFALVLAAPSNKPLQPQGSERRANLLSTPLQDLAALVGGSGRARTIWRALAEGKDVFGDGEAAELSERTRRELDNIFAPFSFTCEKESASDCGTIKLLLRMEDGLAVEAVVIPSLDGGRSTVCVSSQVGCARACSFCMTGTMGLVRSLTADEILGQIWAAKRAAREAKLPPLTNCVYMGMGEPLANLGAVAPALRQMTDPLTFGFGRGHISVSTVGPSPAAIRAMAELPCRLAWSAHAADDGSRKILVPTTAHKMSELRDAFVDVLRQRPSEHLFVEATLIDGVNDSLKAATEIAELLRPLPGRTRVNLLPYNPMGHPTHRPSPPERIAEYQTVLRQAGFVATVRTARGAGESAACGQLATAKLRSQER